MRRVIFCRPLGGLNDTLCRIAQCLQFAERMKRDLIIDTRDSGLMGEFDDYLVFRHETTAVRVITRVTEELLDYLDTLSTYPQFLNHDISTSTFMSLSPGERRQYARSLGVSSLRTDLIEDYPQDLIFYEGGGGGSASFRLLGNIEVSNSVGTMLRGFSRTLPRRYLSAHIRATDYRADADYFLKRLGRISSPHPFYLATDNQELLDQARKTYLEGRVINLPIQSTLDAKVPKHQKSLYSHDSDLQSVTMQMFRDLFALAGATKLYYPLLDPSTTEHGLPKASGFSRLARKLAEEPELFVSFFRASRPTCPPRWPAAHIIAPLRAAWIYWKRQPFRHFPDSLRPRGRLKTQLDKWRGFASPTSR